uniref:Reverse transcriptase n=1 Tax=Solanum tuberosum TaxID=4113 RepID=M1BUU5_SOLTU
MLVSQELSCFENKSCGNGDECVHTRIDKIRNEDIPNKMGVPLMVDKMREAILRWFEHVNRRNIDVPVRRCEKLSMVA